MMLEIITLKSSNVTMINEVKKCEFSETSNENFNNKNYKKE